MRKAATKSEDKPTAPAVGEPSTINHQPSAPPPRFPAWLMAVLLALATIVIYWPVTHHEFINYDDDIVVTSNVNVQNGLTLENVKWAFLNPVNSLWNPLTVLSHMLDCQLYGLKPWGHHLTSLLLHAANTALVFLLLRKLTGAFWRGAMVAALFAAHPLHVESVAWIVERKDVLSTFFCLLALLAYAQFVKESAVHSPRSRMFYVLALLAFALGLMSKAMLVTTPFVLLLLDYWPLERFKQGRTWQLVMEKIPFLALAAAASIVTLLVQKQTGASATLENLPLGARCGNALISYCRYLEKIFWPTDLAVYYPHPGYWPLEQVLLAGVFLSGVSMLLWVNRGRYPFLLMGWLWFVGTLVPVIQLVQTGSHAMADRYAYIPSLGLFVLLVWGAFEFTRRWRRQAVGLTVAGIAAIAACCAVTRHQLGYWINSETLFRHTLAVTHNNEIAQNNLGSALFEKGRIDEAISHFQEAIRLNPDYAEPHYNLGLAFLKQGRADEAVSQFQEAIRVRPDYWEACYNLGLAFDRKNLLDEAISQYQEAVRLKPDDAVMRNKLGIDLARKVEFDEAIRQFQEAVRLKPDDADAQGNLARALELKSRVDSLASDPVAMNNLAWNLAANPDGKIRNGALAVLLAERACEQTHYRVTVMVGTLAAAYAEAGRFDDAVAAGQKACALASEHGETDLLAKNQELLALYQLHQPYHEPAKPGSP